MNIFKQIESIILSKDETGEAGDSGLFLAYKSFFQKEGGFERYYKGVENIFLKNRLGDAVVLDAGCGFGIMAMIIAGLGAKKVSAIDLNPEVIKVLNSLLVRLKPALENIETRAGDAVTLNFPDEMFDAVIVSDAISHVHNQEVFLKNMKRILKKGGRLYLYDSNNSLDIRGHSFRVKYWRQVENGPCDSALLPDKPFIRMREDILTKHFSSLDEKTLSFLSKTTIGMQENEIVKAGNDFLKTGKITKKKGFIYIDPRNGFQAEVEFNPFSLKRRLRENGFKAELIAPYSCFPYPVTNSLKDRVKRMLRFLYPFSLFLSPSFEILGVKI